MTTIRILAIEVTVYSAGLSEREEYVDEFVYYIIESADEKKPLSMCVRRFPGAKHLRNYLMQVSRRQDLEARSIRTNLWYNVFAEEDLPLTEDVAMILEDNKAKYTQMERVITGKEFEQICNKLPVKTLLSDTVITRKITETIVTIQNI